MKFRRYTIRLFEKRNVIIWLRIGLETKERAPGSGVSREASTSADLYESHPDEEHTFVEPVERNPDDRYCFPRRGIGPPSCYSIPSKPSVQYCTLGNRDDQFPGSRTRPPPLKTAFHAVFDRWEIRKSFIRSSMMVLDRSRSWYLI